MQYFFFNGNHLYCSFENNVGQFHNLHGKLKGLSSATRYIRTGAFKYSTGLKIIDGGSLFFESIARNEPGML